MSEDPRSERWNRRPVTLDDAEGLVVLADAIGTAAGIESLMTAADLQADLEHPDVVLDRDTIAIVDGDGAIRAYAIAYDEAPGRSDGEVLIDPALAPDVQDALLDELVGWMVNQAIAIAERRGLSATIAVLAASKTEERMFAAYARHGYSYARTFWRMGLTLSDPHPEPFAVGGFRVDGVDPDDDDVLRRLHALDLESFADHYGFIAQSLDVFATQIRSMAGFDRDAAWIIVDEGSGTDAGFLLGTDRRADDGHGYVVLLGVATAYRGRGLAKCLLARSFDYYRSRGMTGVQLGVDAQNTTGATQLYRSVGMSEWESFDAWELPLTLEDSSS